jgi:MFS family permease
VLFHVTDYAASRHVRVNIHPSAWHDVVMAAVTVTSLRKPFFRYWLSGFLDDFGDGIRLAAFPLLAAQLTRSPVAVAAVTTVQGLPWVLGPVLGVIVDRADRRRLMVLVDVVRAAVITLLAAAIFLRADDLALLYVTALVTGAGSALRNTAAVACVPRLVGPDRLDRANGQVIAGQIIGTELAGPAAGGWLFGLAAAIPFAVNAGGTGMGILLLLSLPGVFQPAPAPGPDAKAETARTVRRDLAEGFGWLRRHADIRDLTIAVGVISAMDAAWFAVFVLYVTRVLHERPGVYGTLLAAGAVGGIAAGAAGARVTRRLGPWGSLLCASLLMATSQIVLGITASIVVAAVMLAAGSAAFALFNMVAVTMRQRLVPDALLGRVTSLYGTVAGGAEALGALAGGAIAATAGIRATMLIGAGPILAVGVWVAIRHRPGQPPRDSPAA